MFYKAVVDTGVDTGGIRVAVPLPLYPSKAAAADWLKTD